jgi:Cu(I)/Ag(I) efflux system membrane fusion protein
MNKNSNKRLLGVLPRKGAGLYLVIAGLILAFFIGHWSNGNDEAAENANAATTTATNTEATQATIWTCSMHPQIRLKEPGKCPICGMDLIPLVSKTESGLAPDQLRMSEDAMKLAEIQTTPVVRKFADAQIRMVGKVSYDETQLDNITAWVGGRITKLYVDFTGASVRKGDPMVQIYSPGLYAAQEELINARKMADQLGNGTSKTLAETAKSTLEAARKKLLLLGLTKDQVDDIETGHELSEYLTIYAPTSGVVIDKPVKEGMYVQTGSMIYSIANLSRVWVMLDAYETDLPWISLGQQVSFTSPSFPGDVFKGKVSFIDPVVNNMTRTVRVRVAVDNKDMKLKPDMFVSGVIQSGMGSRGQLVSAGHSTNDTPPLLIPASAPLITGTRAVVYVQVSDSAGPVFEGREVVLGPRAGDFYIVKSGLHEGELVVTHGAFNIDSELQIEAKPSMMNPAADLASGQSSDVMTDQQDAIALEPIQARGSGVAALDPVYAAYFKVQSALAKDDLEGAANGYREIASAVKKIDMNVFSGQMKDWMQIAASIEKGADSGAAATDIAVSRDAFYCVSNAMIDLQKTFGHTGNTEHYLAFCPMARNKAGAYWLQTEKTINNSYYGAKMLRCGSIKQEFAGTSNSKK